MIRRLVHALTHRHILMSKANLGQIVICRRFGTGRLDLHVTVAETCWHIADVNGELEWLASAKTSAELAWIAERMWRGRNVVLQWVEPS